MTTYYVLGTVGTPPTPSVTATPGTLGHVRWIMAQMLGLDDDENDIRERALWNLQINAACKWMDLQFEYHKQDCWVYKTLPAGGRVVTLEHVRHVRGVYQVLDGLTGKTNLPIAWRQVEIGLGDDPENETAEAKPWESGDDHWLTKAVRVSPADESRVIAVNAAWKSVALTSDTDKNFWTMETPVLLAKAGLREKEIAIGNRQRLMDWEAAIIPELRKMSDDLHAEEARSYAPLRWRG